MNTEDILLGTILESTDMEAYYGGVPAFIKEEVFKRLPDEFVTIMRKFSITKLKCK